MGASSIEEQARRATQDVGQRAREAQIALKQERARAAGEISREAGKARSELEREAQTVLGKVREQRGTLERKADLPGYGAALAVAKVTSRGVEAKVRKSVAEAVQSINKARVDAFSSLSDWHSEQSAKLAESKVEAERQIAAWQRKSEEAIRVWQEKYSEAVSKAPLTPTGIVTPSSPSKEEQEKHQDAIDLLKPWRDAEGQYNLVKFYLDIGPQTKEAIKSQDQEELNRLTELKEAHTFLFSSDVRRDAYKQYDAIRDMGKYNEALNALEKYKLPGGAYDLGKIVEEGTWGEKKHAQILFGPQVTYEVTKVVQEIKAQPKPQMDIKDWQILPADQQELYKPMTPISMEAWTEMPGHLKEHFYVSHVEVPSAVYRRLGPEAKKMATPKLSFWESLTPWEEELGERASVAGVATMGAEVIIPGAYLARHWSTLQPWEKGVGIAVDVASLIPGLTFASALRRAGTSTVKSIGKTVLAEVQAPITMVMHPVESLKSIIYPLESVTRPGMVPLTAFEVRYHTVKIPVGQIGSAREAMAARDVLVATGGVVEVGGREIALTRTALQDVVQGVAVHTTPDVRQFMHGSTVHIGKEGGLYVSPTLHSKFSLSSAFGDLPKGGMPGAIIITDKKILARLQPSGKVYRGQVEMERVLGVGERLPPPSQILISRTASGQKLTLAVIGPKISKAQIARLRVMGSKDVVRDIFSPSWKATRITRDMDDLVELGLQARKLEKELALARGTRTPAEMARLESSLKTLDHRALALARRVGRQADVGRPLRPVALGYGRPLMERVYGEYAERDPEGFARVMRRMTADGRREVLAGLEPRMARDMRARVERVSPNVVVPRVYAGLQRIEVPGEPPRPPRPPAPPPRPPRPPAPPRPPRPPAPPPTIPRLGEMKDEAGRRLGMGSITWKQGLWWITVYPPYRAGNMRYTKNPPAGATMVRGPGSAQKTITKLGINVPEGLLLDMGIMDVRIGKHGRRIKFKRDVKQRTRLGYPVGMPAGVVGLKER